METIETAPKDRVIAVINADHGVRFVCKWNKKKKFWEGRSFGAIGCVTTYWDPDDDVQPTHWEEV